MIRLGEQTVEVANTGSRDVRQPHVDSANAISKFPRQIRQIRQITSTTVHCTSSTTFYA
jgi:hypothetical protein